MATNFFFELNNLSKNNEIEKIVQILFKNFLFNYGDYDVVK